MAYREIAGSFDARGLRVAIVAARFNGFIVEQLVAGAIDSFVRHNGNEDDLTIVRVPGSFELPISCQALAQSGKFDAVVALGVIIRGSTSHYDLVCAEAAKGVGAAALSSGVPVMFGVLTTDTIEQAVERAGTKAGNKGADAMMGAVEMVQVLRQLKERP